MRVFTCTDHAFFWPVGVASVVVAEDAEQAAAVLKAALAEHGLKADEPFTLQELDLSQPRATILCDGEY